MTNRAKKNLHLALLFPPSLDEYVSGGNLVRAINVYVGLSLSIADEFENVEEEDDSLPA